MKKRLFQISLLVILFISLLTVIRSSYQPMPDGLLIDEDALSKVENPGPQGKRQTHLVWCADRGFSVKTGCCYGTDNCSYVYCTTNSFSCDGKEWVQL